MWPLAAGRLFGHLHCGCNWSDQAEGHWLSNYTEKRQYLGFFPEKFMHLHKNQKKKNYIYIFFFFTFGLQASTTETPQSPPTCHALPMERNNDICDNLLFFPRSQSPRSVNCQWLQWPAALSFIVGGNTVGATRRPAGPFSPCIWSSPGKTLISAGLEPPTWDLTPTDNSSGVFSFLRIQFRYQSKTRRDHFGSLIVIDEKKDCISNHQE